MGCTAWNGAWQPEELPQVTIISGINQTEGTCDLQTLHSLTHLLINRDHSERHAGCFCFYSHECDGECIHSHCSPWSQLFYRVVLATVRMPGALTTSPHASPMDSCTTSSVCQQLSFLPGLRKRKEKKPILHAVSRPAVKNQWRGSSGCLSLNTGNWDIYDQHRWPTVAVLLKAKSSMHRSHRGIQLFVQFTQLRLQAK